MVNHFGKRFLKIKVLNQFADSPELHNIIIRHLIDVIDFVFLPGCIVLFTNKRKQRIGDLMTKSMVVGK